MVSPPFEYAIMTLIALNTVVLMMKVSCSSCSPPSPSSSNQGQNKVVYWLSAASRHQDACLNIQKDCKSNDCGRVCSTHAGRHSGLARQIWRHHWQPRPNPALARSLLCLLRGASDSQETQFAERELCFVCQSLLCAFDVYFLFIFVNVTFIKPDRQPLKSISLS